MIERSISNDLLELLSSFPVLGIIGSRQVGKTTLSKQLIKSISKESIYIDLENPKDQAKIYDPVMFFENNIDKLVVLDEVQRMPDLFPVLRSMIDQKREPSRFILLGSASPELIRDSSESLAGRIAYEELFPFNLAEVGANNLSKLWFRGGFPDAFLAKSDKLCSKWHKNFVKTYIERDIPMLSQNVNWSIIQKLWVMLAHISGSVINYTNIGKSLEISSVTLKKYISFMEQAFLIRQLQAYSINVKKRIVKNPKVYVRDTGILHYLLNIDSYNDLLMNPVLGHSWEGFVIEQILNRAGDGVQPFFYRTHQGTECDLVLQKGGRPYFGIEIKYTSSPKITKGLLLSFEDLQTVENYIITPNTDDYMITKNIRVCKLTDFLEKYL
ncbi:MAG: ATP-binding protein [Bacteroidota bacterium]|nr:ATP-binding protein [Bacteroidota bacterium]